MQRRDILRAGTVGIAGLAGCTGYHYEAGVEGVESGDELEVSVETPPQVARHEGCETAFIRMSDVQISAN